ncbi:hypothetical protein LB003_03725 [Loigolactobacillus bifermentans]|nr:DUF6731 family protein [Loigolactobacillus bifermentans]QGG59661.1 hypothetical protein LB003_03725 [Loigolactobacillus bifermentans]
MTKYSGVSIEVKISTTRSKNSVLDTAEVIKSVKEIEAHIGDFKRATITSGDSGSSVPIELINSRLHVCRIFEVPIKKFLDQETVQQDMYEMYSPNYDNYKNEVDKNVR